MVRRPTTTSFAADAFVFPGGKVEPGDRVMPPATWTGLDVGSVAAAMKVSTDLALGFHIAAVRETFEEVGVLLAQPKQGTSNDGGWHTEAAHIRRALQTGTDNWDQLLLEAQLRLDLTSLRWWSWWITPASLPLRYNTLFFVARYPSAQKLSEESREVEEAVWVSPRSALERASDGSWYLMRPTFTTLEELRDQRSVNAILDSADNECRRLHPRP